MTTQNDTREEMSTSTHKPARPLKFFKDKEGNGWRSLTATTSTQQEEIAHEDS